MRLRTIVVTVLTLASLTGCGLLNRDDKDDHLQRILDDNAQFSVFLTDDATAPQKADIEKRLRALPDVTAVSFEDREAAYVEECEENRRKLNSPRPATS